jgi:hypothetical protein
MDTAGMSAKELAERLTRLYYRCRGLVHADDWDALEECIRRIKQHEQLERDVLRDLRARLTEAERAGVSNNLDSDLQL